jgi:hypothetical protein
MNRVIDEARKAFKAVGSRMARVRFLASCFANESVEDTVREEAANRDQQRAEFSNLLVHLRHTLGDVVPELANTVEPDGFLDALVNHLGGKEVATAWWANAWQGVSMPHDVKSALDGIGASKHGHSLNAHAASKLAANMTTKVGARADGATADDHADAYEWHDKAVQQHSAAAVNNPDMAELHEKVRGWHSGQMRAHDDAETEKVNSDPAREEQRQKLMSLVGENRMIQPRYGEVPQHLDSREHAKKLAASADSLSGFLDKATALKRSERANASREAEETQRHAGFMKNSANSSRFAEGTFLRPVRANEKADEEGSDEKNEAEGEQETENKGVARPVGSTTFPKRAATMKNHGWKIGDKVKADSNYGGATGKVHEFSPSGSHVLVDHDDGSRGWYHAEDLEESDGAKDEEGKEEGKPNESLANEGAVCEWVCVSNEVKVDGNWVQLSPYGDFPHTGGVQRFTKDDAQNCVNEFTGLLNVAQRVMGIPFYIGHPDHAEFKQRYTDTKAYGRIKELQAREDGLWGNVKWSEAGKSMVNEEQFHGHSVNWRVRKDAQGFWRPFSVKSVGFTNEPNLPVIPITHANERFDVEQEVENDLLK